MDIYLYDGVKVLYRYGLALFKLHKRRIKALEFKFVNYNNMTTFIFQ